MNDPVDKCLNAKDSGRSATEAASILHHEGLTIVETIKVIKKVYGLSLAVAKSVVTSAPEWTDIVEASEPLHDELERIFGQDSGLRSSSPPSITPIPRTTT